MPFKKNKKVVNESAKELVKSAKKKKQSLPIAFSFKKKGK